MQVIQQRGVIVGVVSLHEHRVDDRPRSPCGQHCLLSVLLRSAGAVVKEPTPQPVPRIEVVRRGMPCCDERHLPAFAGGGEWTKHGQSGAKSILLLKPLHPCHQIRLRRLDDEMVVIAHRHPRMTPPTRHATRLAHGFEEKQPVFPVKEDRLPAIFTGYDVVKDAFLIDADAERHDVRVASSPPTFNKCVVVRAKVERTVRAKVEK